MPPGTPLTIESLCKSFGAVRALDDVSFTVEPGEIFGFVGSNGAGKSTAMRITLGVLAADSGRVLLGGRPLDVTSRRSIGYMPEERGLYPKEKVGAQLIYLARLHGLDEVAARASMEHWTERLGVAEHRDDAVDTLSLGNQQRVQLAAALTHDPAVLVLDEPFSGLDPVAVDVMSDVLREKATAGVPIVFSSHQLDLVQRLSDRVGIISHGRMRALGGVTELRARGGRRLLVTAPHAPTGWADGIPGVREVRRTGAETELAVGPAADDQAVLQAALATGPVTAFIPELPSLTELFREAVSA